MCALENSHREHRYLLSKFPRLTPARSAIFNKDRRRKKVKKIKSNKTQEIQLNLNFKNNK